MIFNPPASTWVIGGAGHFGSALIATLLRHGGRVVCFDLEQRAHALAEKLGAGPELLPVTLDASDPKATVRVLTETWEKHGPADGLVFLPAKTSRARDWDQVSEEQFDATAHFNLTTTYLAVREVATRMQARRQGSIVLISSMYGSVSPDPAVYAGTPIPPNPIDYGVTKAGVTQMGRYLSASLGASGVRCNVVSPGPFPHPNVREKSAEFVDRLAAKTHLGRIGRPEELVGPVLFLLSESASYVTGQNLLVDGGWTVS